MDFGFLAFCISGRLLDLKMVVLQSRGFRLNRASTSDACWLWNLLKKRRKVQFAVNAHLPKMDVKPVHAGRQSGQRFILLNVRFRPPHSNGNFGFQIIPLQPFTFGVTR
jgi:hypothetical protein